MLEHDFDPLLIRVHLLGNVFLDRLACLGVLHASPLDGRDSGLAASTSSHPNIAGPTILAHGDVGKEKHTH